MAKFTIVELPGLRFPWYGRMGMDLWHPLKQWVYQRDGGVCQYCEQPVEYEKSDCHHILEIAEHGSNHPSNLKTLCRKCHKNRHPFMKSKHEKLCGEGVDR